MSSAEIVEQVRGKKLAAKSELFEIGVLETGPLDTRYVRRVNIAMARRRRDMEKDIPATLTDAIKAKGVLRKHAELVVFGNWLIGGRPGAKSRPGRQADSKKILKSVAAIMAEIEWAALKKTHAQAASGRESRKREITKHALAEQWKRNFSARKSSVEFRRPPPLQQAHFVRLSTTPEVRCCDPCRQEDQEIAGDRGALDAITGLLPTSQKEKPEILTEPDVPLPAKLAPFEIALEVSIRCACRGASQITTRHDAGTPAAICAEEDPRHLQLGNSR